MVKQIVPAYSKNVYVYQSHKSRLEPETVAPNGVPFGKFKMTYD